MFAILYLLPRRKILLVSAFLFIYVLREKGKSGVDYYYSYVFLEGFVFLTLLESSARACFFRFSWNI